MSRVHHHYNYYHHHHYYYYYYCCCCCCYNYLHHHHHHHHHHYHHHYCCCYCCFKFPRRRHRSRRWLYRMPQCAGGATNVHRFYLHCCLSKSVLCSKVLVGRTVLQQGLYYHWRCASVPLCKMTSMKFGEHVTSESAVACLQSRSDHVVSSLVRRWYASCLL